jgi:hypothetical protein
MDVEKSHVVRAGGFWLFDIERMKMNGYQKYSDLFSDFGSISRYGFYGLIGHIKLRCQRVLNH